MFALMYEPRIDIADGQICIYLYIMRTCVHLLLLTMSDRLPTDDQASETLDGRLIQPR